MPSLDALTALRAEGVLDVVGVVTQPDRPGHRGAVRPSAVKASAVARGLPVVQPERLRGDGLAALLSLRPELLVWAAYGNVIPRALLEAFGGRAVNVHASLLPRWRGAAPVAHAILAGDAETGVTLMEGTAEMDAGPILVQERTPIGAAESGGELTTRLAALGGDLLRRELPRYLSGELRGVPQDPALVTWAPKLRAGDGELDFGRPADELARRVRAMTPDPGAFTTFRGARLLVTRASVADGTPGPPGTLRVGDGAPHVATGVGWLRLDEVKPAGRRAMSGADWARGIRDLDGSLPT